MTDKAVERYVHDEVDRIANQWGYRYFKYDGTWTAMACRQIYVNDGYKEDDYGQQIFDDPTKSGTAEVVAGEGLELRIACPPGFIPAEKAALEATNAKGSAISFIGNRLRASFVGEKTGTANWTVHFAGSTR